MFKRYHVDTRPVPLRFNPIVRYKIERSEECISCGRCIKACIFDVHKRREDDFRVMAEPVSYLCKGCMRCIRECPQGALSVCLNPDYNGLGNSSWTPEVITTLWSEAEAGRIPVKGAGYKGPFSGPGFDSMLTDMSEIVRPTRDGIHGREYISTYVSLGRRLNRLTFDEKGNAAFEMPSLLDIPFPVIFEVPPWNLKSKNLRQAVAEAASKLGIFMIVEDHFEESNAYVGSIIPRITVDALDSLEKLPETRLLEIDYVENVDKELRSIKKKCPGKIISIRAPISEGIEDLTERLTDAGTDIIHVYADSQGSEFTDKDPRFIKDAIFSIHSRLVDRAIRNEVTLIASGGIALAEHVPKALICGADAVAIDIPYMIALGCKVCERCTPECPVEIGEIDVDWGAQRIMNLMAAWRDQLLEILGAMGLREARRLRGELGRSMLFEELEKENFGQILEEGG